MATTISAAPQLLELMVSRTIDAAPADVFAYGRFLRIERPRLVEQTWMSESTHGLESIVTFSIEPRGRGSEVRIRHTGLPDERERRNHQDGWTSLLEAIEKHVKEKRNA